MSKVAWGAVGVLLASVSVVSFLLGFLAGSAPQGQLPLVGELPTVGSSGEDAAVGSAGGDATDDSRAPAPPRAPDDASADHRPLPVSFDEWIAPFLSKGFDCSDPSPMTRGAGWTGIDCTYAHEHEGPNSDVRVFLTGRDGQLYFVEVSMTTYTPGLPIDEPERHEMVNMAIAALPHVDPNAIDHFFAEHWHTVATGEPADMPLSDGYRLMLFGDDARDMRGMEIRRAG